MAHTTSSTLLHHFVLLQPRARCHWQSVLKEMYQVCQQNHNSLHTPPTSPKNLGFGVCPLAKNVRCCNFAWLWAKYTHMLVTKIAWIYFTQVSHLELHGHLVLIFASRSFRLQEAQTQAKWPPNVPGTLTCISWKRTTISTPYMYTLLKARWSYTNGNLRSNGTPWNQHFSIWS